MVARLIRTKVGSITPGATNPRKVDEMRAVRLAPMIGAGALAAALAVPVSTAADAASATVAIGGGTRTFP